MIRADNKSFSVRRFLCLVSAVLFSLTVTPANNVESSDNLSATAEAKAYRWLNEATSVSFPFDVYRGDIRFAAEINGHDVKLLLDDGFMWDEVLLWGGPAVDALGLTDDGEVSIGSEGEVNAIAATTASGFTIRLPGIEFLNQEAVITPASSGNSTMWAGSVGQVSGTFLKNLVVAINFDTMMMTLIEPGDFEYLGKGEAVSWTPMEIGAWSIPGTLVLSDGRTLSLDFMMDLGYNDQARIATNSHSRIPAPENSIPGILGFNIQREAMRGFFARVQTIEIGGFKLGDVLASFVAEDQKHEVHHEVMIGLGLLSRFNLTFDSARHTLYVEPNGSFADPFEYNMTGLSLGKADARSIGVLRVHPDSPAEGAGIKTGDRVVTINGKKAVEYDYFDLQPLLRQNGETINLTVERDGKELEFSFVLKRVV